jgi:hypothetical protein
MYLWRVAQQRAGEHLLWLNLSYLSQLLWLNLSYLSRHQYS